MAQTLKDSEIRYRRLFEAAQDGILILNAETGMIDDANPYLINMLGYSREALIEKKLWEVGAFQDITASQEAFAVLQDNEYIRYDDLPLRAKDGRLIQVEFVSNVYLVGDKKVIQCNVRDISERKLAQELQQQSQQLFYNIFHASPTAIVLSSLADGRFVEANQSFSKLTGYALEEIIGMTSTEAGITADPKIREERLAALKKDEQLPSFEVEVTQKSGETRAGLATVGIVSLKGEQFALSIFIDITEHKRAEEALRESEQRYRQIIETAHEGVWTIDADNRTTFVNQHLADMLGYTIEEMMGQSVYAFTDEEGKAIGARSLENRRQGINEQLDFKYIRKDGKVVWTIIETSTLWDQAGNYMGALAMVTDITERKIADEKIQRQFGHLTALSIIDRVIASNFDLKLTLLEILNHVTTELGVDAADIFILNTYNLEFGAECGFRTKPIRKAQMRLADSYAGHVVMERKLVQIPNLHSQPAPFSLEPHWADEDFVCYYAVPLIAKGQVKGVLEVFHRKALEPDRDWLDFLNTLAGQTAIAIENATLFSSLQRSNAELIMAYDTTIEGWSRILDLRDKETEGHSLRVTEMTLKLAKKLGLSDDELAQIRWGALLHDIGKMGVPDGILMKQGPLTEDEWVIMKKHPTFAYEMLFPIYYLRKALDIPYCHHEKWDGSGYPRGLKGDHIPLAARIFAVVDVWDALKSNRSYRAGWEDEKVREHIRFSSGTHFDPEIVDVFLQTFR